MSVMWCALLLLVAAGAHARELSFQEIYELPELYQIDDYDRCLSRPGALYCVGTFRLTADRQAPSYHYYRMIEDYSTNPLHFDRRLLHRGYCVTSRCSSSGSNSSELFLNCVREHEKQLGMQISMESHRCNDNGRWSSNGSKENYDQILLWVSGSLLLLNVLGTLYDILAKSEKKNKFLLAWSIPYNWARLNSTQEGKDGSSSPLLFLQGTRVIMAGILISSHVLIISHKLFFNNPHDVEKIYEIPWMLVIRNGSHFIQMFVMMSSILFAYSFIQISKHKEIGFLQFPIYIMLRIIRIMPIHMLVVGFAATWWRHTGDGPLWPSFVITESDTCRRKFFLHVFFLNNLIDNDEHCLPQTWYLAVDMQLHIVASIVLITLRKSGRKPFPILFKLLFASVLMNGLLAYRYGWNPPVQLGSPEGVRTFFRGSRTLRDFYMSAWGSLPGCLFGIIVGYLYEEIRAGGLNFNNSKLFGWLFHLSLPVALSWVFAGEWVYQQQSPLFNAVYLAVERPIVCILLGIVFVGMVTNDDNIVRRMLSWRGWHVMGRLSLPVMMVHWCIIEVFMGSRRTLTHFTFFNWMIEACATCVFSYCLALPLTLLVEMPLMKTFTSVLMD